MKPFEPKRKPYMKTKLSLETYVSMRIRNIQIDDFIDPNGLDGCLTTTKARLFGAVTIELLEATLAKVRVFRPRSEEIDATVVLVCRADRVEP